MDVSYREALKHLKGHVMNRAKPEGSITEAYVVQESILFCSIYFENMEARLNRPPRY